MERVMKLALKENRVISYAAFGDLTGRAVFYFHGFPGSRLEAARFHEVASANHCRLISIDRPGMGYSSLDKKRTLLSFAADLVKVADHLQIDKFSLIGHSGGAPFVAACAYALPNRVHGAAIVSGMAPLAKADSEIGMTTSQKVTNKLIKSIPWLTYIMMWLYQKLSRLTVTSNLNQGYKLAWKLSHLLT